MLNFSFQKIHAVLQLQVSVTHGVSKLSKCSEHLHLQMAIIYVSVTDRTTTWVNSNPRPSGNKLLKTKEE